MITTTMKHCTPAYPIDTAPELSHPTRLKFWVHSKDRKTTDNETKATHLDNRVNFGSLIELPADPRLTLSRLSPADITSQSPTKENATRKTKFKDIFKRLFKRTNDAKKDQTGKSASASSIDEERRDTLVNRPSTSPADLGPPEPTKKPFDFKRLFKRKKEKKDDENTKPDPATKSRPFLQRLFSRTTPSTMNIPPLSSTETLQRPSTASDVSKPHSKRTLFSWLRRDSFISRPSHKEERKIPDVQINAESVQISAENSKTTGNPKVQLSDSMIVLNDKNPSTWEGHYEKPYCYYSGLLKDGDFDEFRVEAYEYFIKKYSIELMEVGPSNLDSTQITMDNFVLSYGKMLPTKSFFLCDRNRDDFQEYLYMKRFEEQLNNEEIN